MIDKNEKEKEKKILPLIKGVAFPFEMIADHFKGFACLIGVASLISTTFSLLLGRSTLCFISPEPLSFCSYSLINVFVLLFITIALMAFVYNRWQYIFSENIGFVEALRQKCVKKDFKALLLLVLYFISWFIIGLGVFVLQNRHPVADWRQELFFFVCVSLGIIFFMFVILNFVVFQHFLQGGRFFAINKTFLPIFDNIYKPIAWFLIYLIVFLYFLQLILKYVLTNGGLPIWFNIFASDFCLYALLYSCIAVLSSSLYFQEKELFAQDK